MVDVEKVEWLNRRSYSAIGLLLGREGRVLLRCDEGLEDWFELLEVSEYKCPVKEIPYHYLCESVCVFVFPKNIVSVFVTRCYK